MEKATFYKYLILIILLGTLKAQTGFQFNNNQQLVEEPSLVPFGTIQLEPFRTQIFLGSDDSSSYACYNFFNTLRANFGDVLELSASLPFYMDYMTRNDLSYYSRGRGDFQMGIKYHLPLGEHFSLGIKPEISFPTGRSRPYPLDSLKHDTLYPGGFLRDFTSTTYGYGFKFIAGYTASALSLTFNYGYFSSYRYQLSQDAPDFHFFAFQGKLNLSLLSPYMQIGFGKFSKNTFGKAPSYLSFGSDLNLLPVFDADFAFLIPLWKKEPIGLVPPDGLSTYPGFLGPFSNFPESFVLTFGVRFKNIVYDHRSTCKLTVIVKDRATGEFVEGCRVKVGAKEYYALSGVIHIPGVKAGVKSLRVESNGYIPVEKFVELEGNTHTKVEVYMVKRELPVLIRVKNTKMEPVSKAVVLVSLGEGENTFYADDNGVVSFNASRENPLSVYVSAPGYIGDNIYIEPPIDRDSVVFNVILKEEKDELAVLPIIYFEVGSYRIKKEFFPFLDIIGRYLVNHPDYKIEVIGHASAEGPERFNQVLSRRRAEECKKHLILRYKIDPERIIVKAFGKDVPAVPNTTEYQRSINRRVEFKLIPPEK